MSSLASNPRKRGTSSSLDGSPNGDALKRMRLGNNFRNDFGARNDNMYSETDNMNHSFAANDSNGEKSDTGPGLQHGNQNRNFNYNFSYDYNDFNNTDSVGQQQEEEEGDGVVEMEDSTDASIIAVAATIGTTARRPRGGSVSTLQAIISTDANAQWDALPPRRQTRRARSQSSMNI